MSKKNKKFKKKFKAEILAQISKSTDPAIAGGVTPSPIEKVSSPASVPPEPSSQITTDQFFVASDLKKIFLVFSALIILLIIIYWINIKTSWIVQAFDLLAKWTNIE